MRRTYLKDECCFTELGNQVAQLLLDLADYQSVPRSVILKEAGVDLSKYQRNGSTPTLKTLSPICTYFGLNPGILVRFACWVGENKISNDQALRVLTNWEDYRHLDDAFFSGLMSRVKQQGNK